MSTAGTGAEQRAARAASCLHSRPGGPRRAGRPGGLRRSTRASGRACHRLDQVVAAHLLEAPIEAPLLASEHRVHRGLHVAVDPSRAGAAEERERSLAGVEDHLLALARIAPDEPHPAVAKPHVGGLHRRRHSAQHDELVRPVELVCLAGSEHQRHERLPAAAPASLAAASRMTAHRAVAALVALGLQRLEDPGQCQPLAAAAALVRLQQLFEPLPVRTQPRQRLLPALVVERRLPPFDGGARRVQAKRLAPRDGADRAPVTDGGALQLREPLLPLGVEVEPGLSGAGVFFHDQRTGSHQRARDAPDRCQRSSVSGRTRCRISRHRRVSRAKEDPKHSIVAV